MWSQVTFLTTHATRGFRFGPVEYVPVRPPEQVAQLPDMGGGVECVPSGGGEVRVCTCERAMVDVLHSTALGGGWEEIFRSLAMVEFFDIDAVIRYTLALDTAVTAARVGYFLSLHRERLFVEEAHLERLAAHAPKQARYLDTSRDPERLVHPWNLIVPKWGGLMLTREQLQRAATDWRTVSAAAVTTTVDDVKRQLLPMLRQDIRPDGGDVER